MSAILFTTNLFIDFKISISLISGFTELKYSTILNKIIDRFVDLIPLFNYLFFVSLLIKYIEFVVPIYFFET